MQSRQSRHVYSKTTQTQSRAAPAPPGSSWANEKREALEQSKRSCDPCRPKPAGGMSAAAHHMHARHAQAVVDIRGLAADVESVSPRQAALGRRTGRANCTYVLYVPTPYVCIARELPKVDGSHGTASTQLAQHAHNARPPSRPSRQVGGGTPDSHRVLVVPAKIAITALSLGSTLCG